MKVIGKDLIFTDPCYIAKDDDWGDSFDYEVEGIGYPGFTEYEWEDTGYGDGSPKVYSIPTYYNPDEFLIKVINAAIFKSIPPEFESDEKIPSILQFFFINNLYVSGKLDHLTHGGLPTIASTFLIEPLFK